MMKKTFVLLFMLLFLFSLSFADSFTDAIQELAMRTACAGQYIKEESEDGPCISMSDYYTQKLFTSEISQETNTSTKSSTFSGVCFDFAYYAWNYIKDNLSYFNSCGMIENQFWLAGVDDDSSLITLSKPTTKDNASSFLNGVPIKTYGEDSKRNIKAHKKTDGERATHHSWIWIERKDKVWFWIDPTWTDNLGYVVYGYVDANGEEIQCRPDSKYCVNFPDSLETLPTAPQMAEEDIPTSPQPPSSPKQSIKTNRESSSSNNSVSGGSSWVPFVPFIDEYYPIFFSVDFPVSDIVKNATKTGKLGFAIDLATLSWDSTFMWGLEYIINLEDGNNLHSLLFQVNFPWRLFSNLAWYFGGGLGVRFDFSNDDWIPTVQDGLAGDNKFAWKIDTGFLINISKLFTKIEFSYNNVIGFSTSLGVGFSFREY